MENLKLESVFKIIDDNIEYADFVGEIDLNKIKEAEKILAIQFPESYIKFINKYGCGDIFGIEIFGIISNPITDQSGIPNVVWLCKNLRKEGLNNCFLPVSVTGDGLYYVLDTKDMENNECPVMLWSPGNQEIDKAYLNFTDFLHDLILSNSY